MVTGLEVDPFHHHLQFRVINTMTTTTMTLWIEILTTNTPGEKTIKAPTPPSSINHHPKIRNQSEIHSPLSNNYVNPTRAISSSSWNTSPTTLPAYSTWRLNLPKYRLNVSRINYWKCWNICIQGIMSIEI